jgi:hypothetical protein
MTTAGASALRRAEGENPIAAAAAKPQANHSLRAGNPRGRGR